MIEVNLLPEQQRSRGGGRRKPGRPFAGGVKRLKSDRDPWTILFALSVIAIPGVVLFLWLGQRSESRELEDRLAVVTADSARLADLRQISDSLTQRQTVIRERVALVEQLDRNRFVWPHLLDEVSRAVPRMVWLTGLRQVAPLPNVSTEISGLAANPLAITEFVRNLQASPYVGEVRIVGSQSQELDAELTVHAFTLIASYAAPAGERTAPILQSSAGS